MELLKNSIWTEPSCNVRGLKCPSSIQPGMLEFNPKSVQSYDSEVLCYDGTEPEICYLGVGSGESGENL